MKASLGERALIEDSRFRLVSCERMGWDEDQMGSWTVAAPALVEWARQAQVEEGVEDETRALSTYRPC